MKFAEVIYETGAHSVLSFENETELKEGLAEQHRRATSGEDGGPTGHPAERIKRVIVYSTHPAEGSGNVVSAEAVRNLVMGMAGDNDILDGNQLIAALRDEMSPTYPMDQGRHESMYKASGTEMSDLSFLGASGDGGSDEA